MRFALFWGLYHTDQVEYLVQYEALPDPSRPGQMYTCQKNQIEEAFPDMNLTQTKKII